MQMQEIVNQQLDILLPFAQRRQAQRDHVQTVIEVLAKLSFRDVQFKILIGRGNNTNIDLNRVAGTHRLNLPRFDGPQQLGL